jgi:outer membrane biosynthesis protein TonB
MRRRALVAALLTIVACGGAASATHEETTPAPATGGGPAANAVIVTDPASGSGDPAAVWIASAVTQRPVLRTALRVALPDSLRQRGVRGDVVLEYVVDTLGRVEPGIRVVSAAQPALAAPARAAVLALRYRPGRVRGRAVRVLMATKIRVGAAGVAR